MPELVLAVARFGFLILLWVFVFAVANVIRRDLFFGARQSSLVAAPQSGSAATGRRGGLLGSKNKKGKTPKELVVTEGSLTGTRIQLTGSPITIGRAEDSTLVLDDDYASTRHARLEPRTDQWLLEDLGSTNGTYLDRAKVTGPTPVPVNVPIRIGRTTIELRA